MKRSLPRRTLARNRHSAGKLGVKVEIASSHRFSDVGTCHDGNRGRLLDLVQLRPVGGIGDDAALRHSS